MEGPSLTQHEVIKFLTLRGGRCTNFELVSNFRGALNHPQHQAEARMKFKDIVNTVAVVGEFQNVKYIELKKEYVDNNFQSEYYPSQPSSLPSDTGSYTSPLTQNFQPYWRYRLSTSTKIPPLSSKNLDYDPYARPRSCDPVSQHMERSVSESTLSHQISQEVQPPPRTRGRPLGSFNRSVSEAGDPVIPYNRSSALDNDGLSRRSSVNGYSPATSLDFNEPYLIQPSRLFSTQNLMNEQTAEYSSGDSRHSTEVSTPDRYNRIQGLACSIRDSNRPVFEHSSLAHSKSFSGMHNLQKSSIYGIQCKSSSNLDRWSDERPFNSRTRKVERSPKRTGICSDEMLRELDEEASNQCTNNSISENIDHVHETSTMNSEKAQNHCSMPEYLSSYSQPKRANYRNPIGQNNSEFEFSRKSDHQAGIAPKDEMSEENQHSNTHNQSNKDEKYSDLDEKNLDVDSVSLCSSSSGKDSINQTVTNKSSENVKQWRDCTSENEPSKNGDVPPVPPERRRRQSKLFDQSSKEEGDHAALSANIGKVKDRVQHFDDLEKRAIHPRRGLSPLLDNKENKGHKANLIEDDVSISVLDPKLKREWFVKAAQGDYYALVGLLKKEPKLAAIKDIATTALHWGAKHGDANIVKLIAGTYGVNPNVRSGYTPVHLATMYKHLILVDLLANTYGADTTIRDYSGKRADQYPENYVSTVAGLKPAERVPLKARPSAKESSMSAFMRIGSLNLRKSRKSAVFASVRGNSRNWSSATELRLISHKSTRKKNSKNIQHEKKCDIDSKNDSDSDSAYGFYSK